MWVSGAGFVDDGCRIARPFITGISISIAPTFGDRRVQAATVAFTPAPSMGASAPRSKSRICPLRFCKTQRFVLRDQYL